ncbi:MAG: hypothetical protein LBR36_09510 [Bacteroidales bacterium]|jgi:hypothetical protein|nr:hypothetical protein [Bacteroidales bacterium]
MFSKIAKTKMYITVATIALSMAVASMIVLYACKKDASDKGSVTRLWKNSSSMRTFSDYDALFEEVESVSNMDETELRNHEMQIGFESFGRISDSIYRQILKDVGTSMGYSCELGAEEMNDADVEFTSEDAQAYVSLHPEYLTLCSSITESGEEEYEFLPKYWNSQFRYVMNEDKMFKVGDNIFKVFDGAVLYTSIGNASDLYAITEANIDYILEVIEDTASVDSIHVFAKTQKCGGKIKDVFIKESSNSSESTYYKSANNRCSGRLNGTFGRFSIENVASDNTINSHIIANPDDRVRVVGNFYCRTQEETYWTYSAKSSYSVFAEWRGCKKCVWVCCKRTLNSDFCFETLHDDTIYSKTEVYKSSKAEWSHSNEVFFKRSQFPFYASGVKMKLSWSSIYNLKGSIWVATASCSFDY